MVFGIACRFDHLIHDDPGGGSVRISHSEIDHILLRGSCLRLHLVDDGENIRRQLLDTVKFLIGTRLCRLGH